MRTDLAVEAKRLWDTSAERKTELPGVKARRSSHHGIAMEIIEILDQEGSSALGKPVGSYVTLDLSPLNSREENSFRKSAEAMARILRSMLPDGERFLVVGLGNAEITPDTLGPKAMDHIIVTRHLHAAGIHAFAPFASVSVVTPGVLGKTGIESVQIVKSAVEIVDAEAVIVVDALASCEPDRLCGSVQISDSGIVPGSGVGNHRAAFTQEQLQVPVIAVGVPTIVDGRTFLECNGVSSDTLQRGLILSHSDIDLRVRHIAKLVGYGIDLALHPFLSVDDVPDFLS